MYNARIRANPFLTARRSVAIATCITLLCTTNAPIARAGIESFQPATNALGQTDADLTAPSPIYTKGTAHDAAHKLGLSSPVIGIDMDTTDHRLFVSDTVNNRILVYNLNGSNALVDRIPDFVLGQPFFWSNAAANTQAGMNTPNGITFDDANNRLFVAQGVSTTSARVTVYDVTSITNGEDAVNVLGQSSFTVSTAATTQEGLNLPTGVVHDATNNRLFVAQNGANRVSVFDVASISDGEAATGVLGQADFVTATAATTQAGMNVPFDVALSGSVATYLFVSQGTGNRVTLYDVTSVTNGENAIKVLGQTTFTGTAAATTQAGMNAPRGIAYDNTTKTLYVSQTTGNRVTTYDVAAITDGENAIKVLGQTNFTNTAAANTQGGLNAPTGVYIDKTNQDLYVPQSGASRVSIFDVAAITDGENAVDAVGQFDDSLSAPTPIYTKGTANNAPHALGMSGPNGVAVDSVNHRLFVGDTSNNRVLVYNLTSGNLLVDRIPDNVLGQAFFYTNAVGTTQSTLSAPGNLAFDPVRNYLFVSDVTNNRIMIFDTASITNGENAVNVLGQVVFTVATAATTQLGLSAPRQLAYDTASQQLFVADSTNNRVMVFDLATITDGETAVNNLGQDDGTVSAPTPIYTKGTANNAAHKLGINAPIMGVVMDTVDHRLFVSDTSNHRVLVYNLDNSNLLSDRTPDYVIGQLDFYSNGNGTFNTARGLNTPNGLDYDGTNKRLFVAEVGANRVKIFDVATITNGEDAVNVLGQISFGLSTAATTQAGMNVPTGVTFDNTNKRLYVAQNTGNRVTVYDLAAGTGDYLNADNALGQTDADLSAPSPIYTKTTAHDGANKLGLSAPTIGIEMDTVNHRLFLSDMNNNRVLVYNLDAGNALLDRVPDNVLGQANFYSNAAANTQTGLNTPNGVTYDSSGQRLFVAEANGNRVKVYDVATITDGENAINVLGQTTFTTATAAVTQAGMSAPTGVVYGGSGSRLYVAQNTANRVTVYDVATITDGENAVGVLGQANFTATTAATTQAGMNVPFDVALSGSVATYLFVSQGTGNRVTLYDVTSVTNGENAIKVLGQTTFTGTAAATTQAGMNAPRGIAYDPTTKTLYVSQTTGNRVTTYDVAAITDGENAIKVLGQTTFTGSAAATTQGGLNAATGVYIDKTNQRLYVPQSGASRVSIFDVAAVTDGENATDALGQYDSNLSTPAPVFTKGALHNAPNKIGLSAPVMGLALDPTDHRLFVSDTGNNRVLVYNLDSNDLLIDRIPDNVLGQANFHSNAAATTQAGMNVPNGLAYDDAGNLLFVAQTTGNRVTVYDVAAITDGENAVKVLGQATFTGTSAATTQAGMNVPTGVTFGGSGSRLYVTQNTGNRVTAYNVADGITDGENAVAVLGQTTFTATAAATTQAGMNVPYNATISGSVATYLFVSQGTGNRVTVYDVTKIADGENAVNVLGQADFTSTAAANTQGGMNGPRGISYDATNKRLYVAQTSAARVTAYELANGITNGEAAKFILGQPLFTTSAALVAQEGLSTPNGVLADPAHNRVYVMDSTTSRVVSYNTNVGIGNGEPAIAVLGQANFTATAAATTQAGMNVPYNMALSGTLATHLFVSQGSANRVTLYDVTTLVNGENATKVLGQTTFTATAAATTQAGMNAPRGIAYDPTTKTLYVSQTTGNRITTYDVAAITDGENAIKVIGQPNFITTTASTRQAGLNAPTGTYIDTTNKLVYVPQSGANRVSIFDVNSITDGEDAVNVLAQTDNDLNPPGPIYVKGTANNAAYKLGLSAPNGVAVDSTNHRLFVADSSNNRILVYNLDSGNVLLDRFPDNVLGQPNFYFNAVATTQAGLSSPVAVTFDGTHNKLYATDLTNNRIVVYDTASITDGEFAVAALGQPSFLVATAGLTQTGLSAPRQLAYDPTSDSLFVADATNNRVVVYGSLSSSTPSTSGGGDTFHFFGL